MNKSKIYKILYYLILLITIFMWVYVLRLINGFGVMIETPINAIIAVSNLVLVIIFSIKIKNKLKKINILFPIIHILFMIIVSILTGLKLNMLNSLSCGRIFTSGISTFASNASRPSISIP